MQLHQLKNGDWVFLVNIARVCSLPLTEMAADRMRDIPPRTIATATDGYVHIVEFESMEEAERYRDELAMQINSARQQLLMGNQDATTKKVH